MSKVGICLSKTEDAGGAEVVACRLEKRLRDDGIDVETVRVPQNLFPDFLHKPATRRSMIDKIALAALTPADVWLNFAETRFRMQDQDALVTLSWNTLYLNHRNIVAYFLSQDRFAYDLYEYSKKHLDIFGRYLHSATSFSRRMVDLNVVARIRAGEISVFPISRNVARRLAKYWQVQGRKIIYPGGYDPRFYYGSRDYVLYFGRLDWNVKRIFLVYDTARMLPEIPFVVAGGPMHRRVDPRVLDPPANVRLELLDGLCPIDRKTRIYSQASCVLYPSIDEDFGIVPVESMSAGKPCIVCADGGGVTETVVHGETGLIVPPNSKALATAVKELHYHGESMRERCQEVARTFSWDRCMDQLCLEIQRSLIRTGGTPARES